MYFPCLFQEMSSKICGKGRTRTSDDKGENNIIPVV